MQSLLQDLLLSKRSWKKRTKNGRKKRKQRQSVGGNFCQLPKLETVDSHQNGGRRLGMYVASAWAATTTKWGHLAIYLRRLP